MRRGEEIMKLYIVDAFTNQMFGGNPAGVVILPEGRDFPDEIIMMKTAAELKCSETAFIRKLGEREFNIRYFTPTEEVDLCGHATIGSFYVLLEEGMVRPGNTYIDDTLAGKLQIQVLDDMILMDMAEPVEGEIIEDTKELYAVMGIEKPQSSELKPQKISTGLPDIMMPVDSEEELKKIAPDFKALTELSKRYEAVGVHAFTINSEDGNVHARNFGPAVGIDEESATGTANGALTYYLYRNGIIKPGEKTAIIQGEKMNRPSEIDTFLSVDAGKVKIQVGGFAATVVSGEINL